MRAEDLSGSEARRAWRTFLAGGAHDLHRVGAHNRQDLLSLGALLIRLAGPGG